MNSFDPESEYSLTQSPSDYWYPLPVTLSVRFSMYVTYILFTDKEVRTGKNCARGFESADRGRTLKPVNIIFIFFLQDNKRKHFKSQDIC